MKYEHIMELKKLLELARLKKLPKKDEGRLKYLLSVQMEEEERYLLGREC